MKSSPTALPTLSPTQIKSELQLQASQLGLGALSITTPEPAQTYAHYEAWLKEGYHGQMQYLARPDRLERRKDLEVILPGVQSVIIATLPYWPGHFPEEQEDPERGAVSCYAWGRDYHKILEQKLRLLASWLEGQGAKNRSYVDTGAIQERELAQRAGLGFIGKNTMLIHPRYGSGFFLGEILTTLALPPDQAPPMPSCGSCTSCLKACPTDAFVAPYVLDARRCISYLTIELKESVPEELRPLIGNRIYGCDICQQVCPWTRFAGDGDSPLWGSPPEEVTAPKLIELLKLDEEAFQMRFEGSPIRRIKRTRLLRNVAIAMGNSNNPEFVPALQEAHEDPDPVIREHVCWALERLSLS